MAAKEGASTSVTVDFASEKERNSGSLRLTEDDRAHLPIPSGGAYADKIRYIRLYPPMHEGVKVSASGGGLSGFGSGIDKGVSTTLVFDLENRNHVMSYGTQNARVVAKSAAFDAAGRVITGGVDVEYVESTRTFRTAAPCYMAVDIEYDEPYTLYEFEFAGDCPMNRSGTSTITKALIFAFDTNVGQSTSLTLDPPPCLWGTYTYPETTPAVASISLSMDPDFPPRFMPGVNAEPIVVCLVRVYPPMVNGIRGYRVGYTPYSNTYYEDVSETLQFTNSSSAGLQKPPVGSVSIVSEFTVAAGPHGHGWYKGPREIVTQVAYDEGTGGYHYTGEREVGPMEMVATDASGYEGPVTSIMQVEYTTSYSLIEVALSAASMVHFTDGVNREGDYYYFEPGYLFVYGEGQAMASIKIDPPQVSSSKPLPGRDAQDLVKPLP